MTRIRLAGGGLALSLLAASVAWHSDVRVHTFDRNRDGRPDLWKVYDSGGRLIERDTDTNFDGRADVVESFDPSSGQLRRILTDDNFDGRFDRLTLLLDGRPVFTQALDETTTSTCHVRSVGLRGPPIVADGSSAWRMAQGPLQVARDFSAQRLWVVESSSPVAPARLASAPRGPPASPFLIF